MELKYQVALYIGIIIAGVVSLFALFYKYKIKKSGNAIKLANTDLFVEEKYFRKQMSFYMILRVLLIITVVGMIITASLLVARPYKVNKSKEMKNNRDIILCLDVSSSVDELNLKLVNQLEKTVKNLSGERIGIVIFNTSSVVLSPLTDDYDYTLEQLGNIKKAIQSQLKDADTSGEDWLYWNRFLYSGTLVGNEERGTSLIADGLLGALFSFPEDEEEQDRTKIIIFSTDNDAKGESYVTLQEAANYCSKHDVAVFGIGTTRMYNENRDELKTAAESTGGAFFLEEDSASFHNIVDQIETRSSDLVEGRTITKYFENPMEVFIWFCCFFVAYILVSLILRRATGWWWIAQGVMVVSAVLLYIFAVLPAFNFSKGTDLKTKRTSSLNVVLVVDNTISMVADDMDDGKTRLDQMKEDVGHIVDELQGANFALISFSNDARVLAPYSDNGDHVKTSINAMYPMQSYYAKGSSLEVPKTALNALLARNTSGTETVVFFFSDGEITMDGVKVPSYKELSKYISGGAVLGYGTEQGGNMRLKSTYDESYTDIMDTTVSPNTLAVSKMDEDNLKSIAKDLGVEYIDMYNPSDIDSLLKQYKKRIEVNEGIARKTNLGEETIGTPKYWGFIFLLPITLLVLINSAYVIKRR